MPAFRCCAECSCAFVSDFRFWKLILRMSACPPLCLHGTSICRRGCFSCSKERVVPRVCRGCHSCRFPCVPLFGYRCQQPCFCRRLLRVRCWHLSPFPLLSSTATSLLRSSFFFFFMVIAEPREAFFQGRGHHVVASSGDMKGDGSHRRQIRWTDKVPLIAVSTPRRQSASCVPGGLHDVLQIIW